MATLFPAAALADPVVAEAVTVHETTVSVPPTAVPTPSPDADDEAGDPEWYGHWTLLTGMIGGALYAGAVYGTFGAQGDDQAGGGIGSGYLLIGTALTGAMVHVLHDNATGAVISGVSRVVFGIAAPSIAAAACPEGDACQALVGVATAAGTMAPVLVDAFALSWE